MESFRYFFNTDPNGDRLFSQSARYRKEVARGGDPQDTAKNMVTGESYAHLFHTSHSDSLIIAETMRSIAYDWKKIDDRERSAVRFYCNGVMVYALLYLLDLH